MPLRMTDQELALFAQYVASLTGIALTADKRYLLEGRLGEVAEAAGCASFTDLYQRAKSQPALERRIVDAISTNETSFFRDRKVFDLVKHKLVPDLLGDDLGRPVSVWSAASSTGQEAYSLCMVLEEILFDLSKCRIRVFGTDISEAAVNAANRGEFSALELGRGLDPRQQAKYFTRVGDRFRVRDDLRALCRFQVDNLLAPRNTAGPFDLVLCRNVLIYFSAADKARVVGNLLRSLKKGGALIVGSTESLLGVSDRVVRQEFHGATYYTQK